MKMTPDRKEPLGDNGFQSETAALILDSHHALTGQQLIVREGRPMAEAEALYRAPFVVLAHDTAPDPVFFYANLAAQALFEMSWAELVCLPSRYSAEPLAREERAALLERVSRQGYIGDYAGVRIGKSGNRFRVSAATVWNLLSPAGERLGQAATFSRWEPLPPG